MTSAATLTLSTVFIYNSGGKRMEAKAKRFSLVTFVKEVDLTANLLSFLWPGKGDLSCRQISSDFQKYRT